MYEIDDNEELMIMAGAFYPNYFTSTNIDLQEAVRMCNGKDFRNTVQLRNFPREEGVLYTQKICDMFKVCSKLVKASFQDTKCFVEFNSSQVTSGVNLGVYLAVQMRLLSIPLRIKRYNAKITYQKLKRHKQLKSISSSTLSQTLDTTRSK
ncbi:ATP-dependent RNA helicase TDRD9 [Brachionus plicatilis]|uniref:ATP-dependent RNA helicase TDRD9 n=1 Tax=Brachionus plicatilis TaxID=10195 RepID=A0A3M7P9Z8_BRAPC|nr:ATP-dependent RNA helicase TDRD9 [Brachionus plicatilis]